MNARDKARYTELLNQASNPNTSALSDRDHSEFERLAHEIDQEARDKVREYRGVLIFPKNVHGMYSARLPAGDPIAADTLAGMRDLIREGLRG